MVRRHISLAYHSYEILYHVFACVIVRLGVLLPLRLLLRQRWQPAAMRVLQQRLLRFRGYFKRNTWEVQATGCVTGLLVPTLSFAVEEQPLLAALHGFIHALFSF